MEVLVPDHTGFGRKFIINLEPTIKSICKPYETILDRLLAEGRISESEREEFRQQSRPPQKHPALPTWTTQDRRR